YGEKNGPRARRGPCFDAWGGRRSRGRLYYGDRHHRSGALFAPGFDLRQFRPAPHDARCIPMVFRVNNTQDPVPNPLGAAFLSVATAKAGIQEAMDQWNQIPTSYMQFQMGADYANAGVRKFDMINEITFRSGAGFVGVSTNIPTRLLETSLFSNGDDIDGDGDSDVSNTISTCTDIDSDGDLEWPAGTYDGGTILD